MCKFDPIVAIREETPSDLEGVQGVNRAAFGGNEEASLVARLYADGDVLFGLAAEIDGVIAGHVLFSKLPITLTTGETIAAAALAPLAVAPRWQRQGIGSALVMGGLAACRQRGIAAAVVLGDPAYYTRLGFSVALASRLQTPWSGPHLMAIELKPGSLGDGEGVARYAAAFIDLVE